MKRQPYSVDVYEGYDDGPVWSQVQTTYFKHVAEELAERESSRGCVVRVCDGRGDEIEVWDGGVPAA